MGRDIARSVPGPLPCDLYPSWNRHLSVLAQNREDFAKVLLHTSALRRAAERTRPILDKTRPDTRDTELRRYILTDPQMSTRECQRLEVCTLKPRQLHLVRFPPPPSGDFEISNADSGSTCSEATSDDPPHVINALKRSSPPSST